MRLSEKAISDFAQLYKQEFGGKLSRHDAEQAAVSLLRLADAHVQLLANKPCPPPKVHTLGTHRPGEVR